MMTQLQMNEGAPLSQGTIHDAANGNSKIVNMLNLAQRPSSRLSMFNHFLIKAIFKDGGKKVDRESAKAKTI